MARTKEQIIADLKADKDFADLPEDEIEEMAEMEYNAQSDRRYEQSTAPRKQAVRVKKIDDEKVAVVKALSDYLATLPQISEIKIANPQKTLDFKIDKNEYSLNLVKHRPEK